MKIRPRDEGEAIDNNTSEDIPKGFESMSISAIRIHDASTPLLPGRNEPTLYEPKNAPNPPIRRSEKLLIEGEYYRIEFAELGAPPSKVAGTIVGREAGGAGQFRLVPIARD